MVLGKTSKGPPTNLDNSRHGPTGLAGGAGWIFYFYFFLASIFSRLPPSLWELTRYRPKYCLKGFLNPKQPTNSMIGL